MIYRFKTKDCPDADGRTPIAGEQKWTLDFPLPDGGKVYIEVGAKGMAALKEMLGWEERDDLADLRAKIGSPPPGSHPSEMEPRAATWHEERLNWIKEVELLRRQLLARAGED